MTNDRIQRLPHHIKAWVRHKMVTAALWPQPHQPNQRSPALWSGNLPPSGAGPGPPLSPGAGQAPVTRLPGSTFRFAPADGVLRRQKAVHSPRIHREAGLAYRLWPGLLRQP